MCDFDFLNEKFFGKSDEELFRIFPDDDKKLTALLTPRYMRLIKAKAFSMAKGNYSDTEDLVQEGFLGFMNAVSAYNPEKNTKFSTFAEVCITNKMKTALMKIKKNNMDSIEDIDMSGEQYSETPESQLMLRESVREIYDILSSKLSKREWDVFHLFVSGETYEQISVQLGIKIKAVDNAVQRIRRKLKPMLKQIK